jgi:S1-C subfamily serine protease
MNCLSRVLRPGLAALWAVALLLPGTLAWAQTGGVARKDASVAVDGVLKQVFRSQRPGRYDYIAQVEVARAELRKRLDANAKVAVPVPGDVIYVHLTQKLDNAGRVIAADSHAGLPAEGSEVKVYLAPRAAGGWEGAYPDWVDVVKGDQGGASELFPPEPTAVNQTGGGGLGLKADVLKVQGRIVLRVTAVERGSPAQEAGLEVGDVIAGANGGELTGADQLDKLAAAGKPFSVIIVDVNSGKPVQVDVNPGRAVAPAPTPDKPANTTPAPAPAPAPQQKVSLGLSAEEVRLGNRSALKVTRVAPDGLGAKAGVEVGDVIVSANGIPTTGPEQLVSALKKSGSELVLTIRDSRTNKDVDVKIPLGAGRPERPAPANTGVPIPGTNPNALGVVTELAFHENEFAVKIVEVADGSAAAKAGLKPGLLITEANGKPVLHPNELNDAVRNSGGRLKLTVVEPNSGRSANLNLDLR